MHFIASSITDPAKLVQLPFAIFDAASTFAIAMAQQGMAMGQQGIVFAGTILKIVISG